MKIKPYNQGLCTMHKLPVHPATNKCPMCVEIERLENRENAHIDIDYVVQIKFMSDKAAHMTRLHLTELGYEAEVVKMAV